MAQGVFRRFKKGYYVTAEVILVDSRTRERITKLRRTKIFVYGEKNGVLKGRIVKDGREVEYENGEWLCFAG